MNSCCYKDKINHEATLKTQKITWPFRTLTLSTSENTHTLPDKHVFITESPSFLTAVFVHGYYQHRQEQFSLLLNGGGRSTMQNGKSTRTAYVH